MTASLCDSNVWLALSVSPHVHHIAARDWFEGVTGPESVFFCRATQQSFLRLLTTSAIHVRHGLRPRTNAEAWAAYLAVRSDERIGYCDEPPELERWWVDFATRSTASPKLWMDAHLAAFARAASLQFVTTDRGFRQFEGLDVLLLGEASSE